MKFIYRILVFILFLFLAIMFLLIGWYNSFYDFRNFNSGYIIMFIGILGMGIIFLIQKSDKFEEKYICPMLICVILLSIGGIIASI
jgi:hypothetical protein